MGINRFCIAAYIFAYVVISRDGGIIPQIRN